MEECFPKITMIDIRKEDTSISSENADVLVLIANLENNKQVSIARDVLNLNSSRRFLTIIVNIDSTNYTRYNRLKDMYDVIITISEYELDECIDAINKLVRNESIIGLDLADIKTLTDKSFISNIYISKGQGSNKSKECAMQLLSNIENKYKLNNIKKGIMQIKCGQNVSLADINICAEIIAKYINQNANIIYNFTKVKNLKDDEMVVRAFFSI